MKRDGYAAWGPEGGLAEVLKAPQPAQPEPVEKAIEAAPLPGPVLTPTVQPPEVVRTNTKSLPARYKALADRLMSRWESSIESVDDAIAARITEHVVERLYGKAVQPFKNLGDDLHFENLTLEELGEWIRLTDKIRGEGKVAQALPPPAPDDRASSSPNPADGRGFGSKTLADVLDPDPQEDE